MPVSVEDRIRSLRDAGTRHGPPPAEMAWLVSQRIDARAATVRRQRRALASVVAVVLFAAGIAVGVRSTGSDDRTETTTATPRSGASGWMTIADSPLKERAGAVAVSMGGPVLVFGGYDRGRTLPGGHTIETEAHRAAVYDPAKGTWREATPPPDRFRSGTLAWTGEVVYLLDQQERLYRYDPAADRWTRLAPLPVEHGGGRLLIWTGEALVAFDGTGSPRHLAAATYEVDRDRWHLGATTAGLDDGLALQLQWAAWTGSQLLVPSVQPGTGTSVAGVGPLLSWSPATGWKRLGSPPLAESPTRSPAYAGWTGSEYVIGGGQAWSEGAIAAAAALSTKEAATPEERSAAQPHPTDDAVAWNPATGSWRALPAGPVHTAPFGAATFWTGTELLILPTDTSFVANAEPPLLLLDPVAGRWRVGAPPRRGGVPLGSAAAWTGRELLLFGGGPATITDGGGSCCPPSTRALTYTP